MPAQDLFTGGPARLRLSNIPGPATFANSGKLLKELSILSEDLRELLPEHFPWEPEDFSSQENFRERGLKLAHRVQILAYRYANRSADSAKKARTLDRLYALIEACFGGSLRIVYPDRRGS